MTDVQRDAGFSVVEAMVAAAVLTILAVVSISVMSSSAIVVDSSTSVAYLRSQLHRTSNIITEDVALANIDSVVLSEEAEGDSVTGAEEYYAITFQAYEGIDSSTGDPIYGSERKIEFDPTDGTIYYTRDDETGPVAIGQADDFRFWFPDSGVATPANGERTVYYHIESSVEEHNGLTTTLGDVPFYEFAIAIRN